MNYTNFTSEYVKTGCGMNVEFNQIHTHKTGSKCMVEFYGIENSIYIQFENGFTTNVEINGSVIKISLENDYRTRDLSTHPSWNTNRKTLVRCYLHHILSNRAKENIYAIQDLVSENLNF